MIPLGKVQQPDNSYSVGQHFLHDQFNYRGLVLFEIPHSRYTYDEKSQDYVLNEEIKYMALVDQRDVPQHESHMVQDIFKDAMMNLRNVDGFDIVSQKEIRPYKTIDGEQGIPPKNRDSYDFENYWYKKFIYDYDGQPKETGNLLLWKNDYFNYETLSTFERTCWPEGIRVSISPVFLAYNCNTQVVPQFCWKYHLRIELLTQFDGVHYKIKRHNFTWQGDDTNQQIETGPGLNVGSDFVPGSPNLRRKRNIGSITLTTDNPIFKFTSSTMLPQPNALFFGNLLVKDHRGREFMLPLPSFNLSVDPKKLEIQKLLIRVPQKNDKKINVDQFLSDMDDVKPKITKKGSSTIVTGVKLTKKPTDPDDDKK